jgi:hypothetical protein
MIVAASLGDAGSGDEHDPRPMTHPRSVVIDRPPAGFTPDPRLVRLDPDRLSDCQRLSDVVYAGTGIEIDPGAIRDVLRILVGK